MDILAHTAVGHASLVARTLRISQHDDIHEYARKVWASFHVPKATCCASKVEKDYSAPSAPHSLDRDQFLPLQNIRFVSQDYWLMCPQKTLAYTKPLQHWAKRSQPLIPGESCQVAESMWELRCEMKFPMTFTDEEVLEDLQSSNWVRITPSKSVEPTPRECSMSQMCHTCARGLFLATYGGGWPKVMTTTPDGNSIGCTSPEGGAKTGRQHQSTTITHARVCGNSMVPAWQYQTLSGNRHSPRIDQGSEPHLNGGVHHVLCPIVPGCHFWSHVHQYGHLFDEFGRCGNWSPGRWPPHSCPPR